MKHKVIKKFLDVGFFEKLKNIIMGPEFPWRKRDESTGWDHTYFSYCFFNSYDSKSDLYQPFIIPILQKLKVNAPIQVRANMLINKLFKTSSWHVDYDYKCKTAILYLNDCDGGTELQINNKTIFVKAEANKIVIFDTDIKHRALTSKNEPVRFIINFNYFKEG